MVQNYWKHLSIQRIGMMLAGNVILSAGISLFKLAQLGNDCYNAMCMAVSDKIGMSYGTFYLVISVAIFLIQLVCGRQYIGLGTIVNMCLNGYITSFFIGVWQHTLGEPTNLLMQLIFMGLGVIGASLGLSFYQTADAGVSPYDSLPIILDKKVEKVPYFVWRILFDGTCALVAYLCGGLINIGTLVAAFGLGPVTNFFDVNLSRKLMKQNEK